MAAPDIVACSLSCAPLRSAPSHRAEMSSQFLFGETARVVDATGNFWKVFSTWDDYEGWIDPRQFAEISEREHSDAPLLVEDFCAEFHRGGEILRVPMGASIHRQTQAQFHGTTRSIAPATSAREVLEYARRYVAVPYLWGGRSPWGIDCSGLVQVVFRAFGLPLPRDSWEQMGRGENIAGLSQSLPGDLAFFEGSGDHVGLVLGGGEILHASGSVRIDDLSEHGITHRQTRKLTHRLVAIRRILPF